MYEKELKQYQRAKTKAYDYCYFHILRRVVMERHPEIIEEVIKLTFEEMSRHPKYGEGR